MALLVNRLYRSGTYLRDGPLRRVTETFKVWQTDGSGNPDNLTPLEAVNATGIPAVGISYNHDGIIDADLISVSQDLIHEPGTASYRVVVTYEGIDDTDCSFNQQAVNQIVNLTPLWRTDALLPIDGIVAGDDRFFDIGGLSVDVAGKPTSQIRHTESLDITVFFNTATGEPDYQTFGTLAGTRNGQAYLGTQPGFLLYVGATSRIFRNFIIAITHKFIWDELYHLVQVPQRDQDGYVALKDEVGNDKYQVAREVYWRQPFPLSDFSGINPCFNGPFTSFALDIPRRDQIE